MSSAVITADSASCDVFSSTGLITGDADGVSELLRFVNGGLGRPCTGQGCLIFCEDVLGVEANEDILLEEGKSSGTVAGTSSSNENLTFTRGEFWVWGV